MSSRLISIEFFQFSVIERRATKLHVVKHFDRIDKSETVRILCGRISCPIESILFGATILHVPDRLQSKYVFKDDNFPKRIYGFGFINARKKMPFITCDFCFSLQKKKGIRSFGDNEFFCSFFSILLIR